MKPVFVITNFYGNPDYNKEIIFDEEWDNVQDFINNDTMLQKELYMGYATIYVIRFNGIPEQHYVRRTTVYY